MASVIYNWQNVVSGFFVDDVSTAGAQDQPAIAATKGGASYFSVWTDPQGTLELEGRIIGSNGTPAGSEFPVNSTTTNDQSEAAIATLKNGNFVVAFTDTSVDAGDIRARLFTSAGAAVDVDFGITAGANIGDSEPDVAALDDGGFVVTWTRDFSGNHDVEAQIVNADGSERNFVTVDGSQSLQTDHAQVAGLKNSNGNFVVVYQQHPPSNGTEVYFAIFNSIGSFITNQILIDTAGVINEDIQVVALQDGGFAVAYTDSGWGTGTDITFKIFNADGSGRTSFIEADTGTAGDQNKPSLTVLSNGYIVVSWNDGDTLVYQAYDPNGNLIGDNQQIAGNVVEAEIAALTGGLVASVRSSTFPDAGGDQSIRSSVEELTRTTTSDDTGETLTGDSLRDNMVGNGGDDILIGLGGNDLLDGGLGDNSLNGGTGADTATYLSATSRVRVSLATAGVQDTLGAGIDALISIENLIGSDFNDTLTGNDSVNVLNGGAGNDRLDGGKNSDTMIGGAGNDTYYVAQAGDTVDESGGDGVDTVISSISFSLVAGAHLLGDVERLTLTGSQDINGSGNALNNILTGNSGNNVLDGGTGADRMIGGNGNDIYTVDDAGDKVDETGGGGIDTVKSSISFSLVDHVHAIDAIERLTLTGSADINGIGNDLDNTITGNSGRNTLSGRDGADTLTGGLGIDTLIGGNGNDKLYGDDGLDALTGGAGADSLTGGLDSDAFVFLAVGDSTVAAAGRDTIQDFNHVQGDFIDVAAIDAKTAVAGNQAFTFIGAAAFSGTAGELRAVVTASSSIVSGDVNGDAVADFAILVRGVTPLQASDFTL